MSLRKLFFTTLLATLLLGCTPEFNGVESPVTPLPTAEAARGVQVRLHNQTGADLTAVTLTFDDVGVSFDEVAQGDTTDYASVERAYQSVAITAEAADGTAYTVEPLELEFERDNPITAGRYTLNLTEQNGNLLAQWQPETEPAIEPIVERLTAAGAEVETEPVMTRGSIFDDLLGESVTTRQILRINGERVDLFLFPSAEIAQEAAGTIKFGGSEFEYTRDDGQTIRIFADWSIGTLQFYWLTENMLIQTDSEAVAAVITDALDTEPLYDPESEPPLQVRLANVSTVHYDDVNVTFPDGSIHGTADLPSGGVTGYAPVDLAYAIAPFQVTVGDEVTTMEVVDFVGENPLPNGRYTFAIDWKDGAATLAVVRDDELRIDAELIGTTWYWIAATPQDGEEFEPSFEERSPLLQFTEASDPNGAGGLAFGGYSGCNSLFGSYFVSGLNQIVISGVGQTAQGCQDPIAESERYLTAALQGITSYEIRDETLRLYTLTGDELMFTADFEEVSTNGPLKGYQIFSWEEEGSWRYALVVATNRTKMAEEIMNAEVIFSDAADLVAQLQTLPARTALHWPDAQTAALLTRDGAEIFLLPPDEVITQVIEGAGAADLPISVGRME